jgi:hypothetical protein
MVYADIVLSTLLVLFAGLTYVVYRKLVRIEEESLRATYDPELMVKGWWRGKQLDGSSRWEGNLFLCNPGPTPIVLMSWGLEAGQPGSSARMWDADTADGGDTMSPPVVVPGYSSMRVRVEVRDGDTDRFHVQYSTSRSAGKKAVMTSLLPDEKPGMAHPPQ